MSTNPYESPREAGYDAPKSDRPSLWLRMVVVGIHGLVFGFVGWVLIAFALATLDLADWVGL